MISLDPYVVETLMGDLVGHDRQPSAFLVYLSLWSRTGGGQTTSVPTSLRILCEETGLSKRSVQSAVAHLAKRQLIVVHRAAPTAAPRYDVLKPWRRRAGS